MRIPIKLKKLLFMTALLLGASYHYGFTQSIHVDSIYFTVRIGSYRVVPESVKKYIDDKDVNIILGISCIDTSTFSKIHVGNFACYKEAKSFAEQAIKDGYESAFVVAFNRTVRIKLQDAIKKSKKKCKSG